MSKKYKNKVCVYCAQAESSTGDHVFAREFFLLEERGNPIKVPACNFCNNKKSEIEHYLASVLPFGGRHPDAKEHLFQQVPQRLEKNKKLKNDLRVGKKYGWLPDGSMALGIPFDGEKFIKLSEYISRALSWYHWDTLIRQESFIYAMNLTSRAEEFFQSFLFKLNAKNRVNRIIGKNTVQYRGEQGVDNDQLTIWQFQFFNGLELSSSVDNYSYSFRSIGVISSPTLLKQTV